MVSKTLYLEVTLEDKSSDDKINLLSGTLKNSITGVSENKESEYKTLENFFQENNSYTFSGGKTKKRRRRKIKGKRRKTENRK